MKLVFLFIFLPVLGFGALTDADFIKINYKDDVRPNISHEMIVAEARDEEHLEELLEYYSEILKNEKNVRVFDAFYSDEVLNKYNLPKNLAREAIEKNWSNYFPDNKSESFELGEKGLAELYNLREPSSEKFNPFQRIESGKLKEFPERAFRITLTAVRTGIGGAASGWAFAVTGLPIVPSIIMGTMVGGMSGAVQWWIDPFVEFLETKKVTGSAKNWLISKMPFLEKVGINKVKDLSKKSSQFNFYLKWFLTEFAFVSVIESTLGVMGAADIIEHNKLFWEVAGGMATSSLFTLATQGVWESSVVKEFSPKEERIKQMLMHARKNKQINRIHHLEVLLQKIRVKKSAMFVYGSAVQISALVFKTMGYSINYFIFGYKMDQK